MLYDSKYAAWSRSAAKRYSQYTCHVTMHTHFPAKKLSRGHQDVTSNRSSDLIRQQYMTVMIITKKLWSALIVGDLQFIGVHGDNYICMLNGISMIIQIGDYQ